MNQPEYTAQSGFCSIDKMDKPEEVLGIPTFSFELDISGADCFKKLKSLLLFFLFC